MTIIAKVLIALVALEHLYFLVLEMFLWTTPRTRAAFGMSAEQAEQTKVLAANQGLYNGFLAAGLVVDELVRAHLRLEPALHDLGHRRGHRRTERGAGPRPRSGRGARALESR